MGGFPRNLENYHAWEDCMGTAADVVGVLVLEVGDEDVLEKRLLRRAESSGRSDDNISSIRKRFSTHIEETMPVVEMCRSKGMTFVVDASPAADQVWLSTKRVVQELE